MKISHSVYTEIEYLEKLKPSMTYSPAAESLSQWQKNASERLTQLLGLPYEKCEPLFDIEYAMNGADMIIARSGSSVSEMLAAGKPAILIPSPNVAGNHQEHNARAVEKAGAAVVICEDNLTKESLKSAAESILFDDENLKKMSAAAENAAITDAAERLYALLNEIKK